MKLEKQDWQKLQIPLLVLVVVVIVVLVLIALAQNYSDKKDAELQAQQNQLSAARQRYQSSGAEKDIITEYLPQYQKLINKGFVGEERRIEWVEELRTQHKEHKLFGVKYNISQQSEYKPSFAPNLGVFVFNRSTMKLDLDMLHEGDILQLVESLSTKNHAPFMLRECEVTRMNVGATKSSQLIANLHALCELDWFTMREPITTAIAVAR